MQVIPLSCLPHTEILLFPTGSNSGTTLHGGGWGGKATFFLFKVGKTSEVVSTNFVMIVALHLYGYY